MWSCDCWGLIAKIWVSERGNVRHTRRTTVRVERERQIAKGESTNASRFVFATQPFCSVCNKYTYNRSAGWTCAFHTCYLHFVLSWCVNVVRLYGNCYNAQIVQSSIWIVLSLRRCDSCFIRGAINVFCYWLFYPYECWIVPDQQCRLSVIIVNTIDGSSSMLGCK